MTTGPGSGFQSSRSPRPALDPCFDSLCSVSDYSGQASQSPLLTEEAGNLRLWSLPLGVQLPSLLLIPVCLVVVGVLVVLAARGRDRLAAKARELRLLTEMSLASAAIVLGYTSSTLTGPAHLRYGFARDFLLPAFLSGIVAVSLLASPLGWVYYGAWLLPGTTIRDWTRWPGLGWSAPLIAVAGLGNLWFPLWMTIGSCYGLTLLAIWWRATTRNSAAG